MPSVAALVEASCDAVWVGWGFVAEDPTFAELCDQIGVTFIGPSAEAMRKLGEDFYPNTDEAKEQLIKDLNEKAKWIEKQGEQWKYPELYDKDGERATRDIVCRGVADRIDAVIWFSDLRGFTRITDTAPEQVMASG